MSLWTESELAALNDARRRGGVPETFAVLRHALEVAEASGGAFDPTVEPLVRAAGGFGGPPRELGAEETRALLERVGHRARHPRRGGPTACASPGARAWFSTPWPRATPPTARSRALRGHGATSGLVDLGGSTLAMFGAAAHRRPARPLRGVRGPGAPSASPTRPWVPPAATRSPATSWTRAPGRRHGAVLQASVVAPDAREADALSTAVFVLGADAGLDLLVDAWRRGARAPRRGRAAPDPDDTRLRDARTPSWWLRVWSFAETGSGNEARSRRGPEALAAAHGPLRDLGGAA